MLIKEFAIAASVFALTACAGAQADLADADHVDHDTFAMDPGDYSFSSPDLSHDELIELRREINEGVREELAAARLEIHEALAETGRELAALDIELHFDTDGQLDVERLSETVLMSVETALQEVRRGLEQAERQLARDEVRLARQAEHLERQAEHMARQAERMNRKAAEMKARADAMKREAERMKREEERLREEAARAPKAPKVPGRTKLIEPERPAPALAATSVGKPLQIYRQASPYIH